MKILTINPGSTSTKFAVYDDLQKVGSETVRHSADELAQFAIVADQFEYRRDLVLKVLAENNVPLDFDAVVGRGGMVKPCAGGVYRVNDTMIQELIHSTRQHASNLGCRLAADIASRIEGCQAFIADPITVDEIDEVARITGIPEAPRNCIWHALNQRAIARRYAKEHGLVYENLNLIVAHLGGGITIGAHKQGRVVDVNNGLDGEGPIAPERAGSVTTGALVDLCYSGKFSLKEMKLRLYGNAGLNAHIGSTNMVEIEEWIKNGNEKAALVVDAMAYQTAKSIGALAAALSGKVDAILLTGGVAYSDYVVPRIKQRVEFIAPIFVYPGEDEMLAMATNGQAALKGEIPIKEYK